MTDSNQYIRPVVAASAFSVGYHQQLPWKKQALMPKEFCDHILH
jgi:hypothetical protein